MQVKVQPIPLSSTAPSQPSQRLIKRGALAAFKLLRASAAQAGKLPGALAQASADVRSAWAESCPKS